MKPGRVATMLAGFMAATLYGCADAPDPTTPVRQYALGPAQAASVTLTPANDTINAVGNVLALDAAVRNTNGDVISWAVSYSTSDAGVATVSASGQVTAHARGAVSIIVITAETFEDENGRVWNAPPVADTADILVRQVVATYALSPAPLQLPPGGATLAATPIYLDSNNVAVDGGSTRWSSSDPAIATVDAGGVITSVALGKARLVARVRGSNIVSPGRALATVTVGHMPPAFDVTPAHDTLNAIGFTTQLTASGAEDADGHALPVTWRSLNARASVDGTGLVTALRAGPAVITARAGLVLDTVHILIRRVLAGVVVTPADLALEVGGTETVSGEAVDSNGVALGGVRWLSSDPSVATVDAAGQVTAVAPGTANIVGYRGAFADTVVVTVTEAPDGSLSAMWPGAAAGGARDDAASAAHRHDLALMRRRGVRYGSTSST